MFTWDARKRQENLRKHGFDFADAYRVFDGFTLTEEDVLGVYGEQRLMTLGFLNGVVVSVTHTERASGMRVISIRKASRHETQTYYEGLAD
jgi:uncharacterized DUF497 family protein